MRILSLLLSLIAFSAMAQERESQAIVAGLTDSEIRIDGRFSGASLVLFGSRNLEGDVVTVVRGPERDFIVRKKERVGGIWMNTKSVTFKDIPQFYALAKSGADYVQSEDPIYKRLLIGEDSLLPANIRGTDPALLGEMKRAFLRAQERSLMFTDDLRTDFVEDTLFKTKISFPDRIPRGRYVAEIYLFNGGQLLGMETMPIQVYKGGTDAFIYDLAHRHGFIYGLIAVSVALLAGWVASTLFEKIYV